MNTNKYPNSIEDILNELVRRRCEKLLSDTLESEIEEWLSQYQHLKDSQGRQRIVRNGYLPERAVQTGVGDLKVLVPRSRDRFDQSRERIQFTSNILPTYLRRLSGTGESLTWLCLESMAGGDFTEVLVRLLGRRSSGLNAEILNRVRQTWRVDWVQFHTGDLSKKDYAAVRGDVVRRSNLIPDLDGCLMVGIGITESGRADMLSLVRAQVPSEQIWKDMACNLRKRGLNGSLAGITVGGAREPQKVLQSNEDVNYFRQSGSGAPNYLALP